MDRIPGFGWTNLATAANVTFMAGGGKDIKGMTGEFVNEFAEKYGQKDAEIADVSAFSEIITRKLSSYFTEKGLESQVAEVHSSRLSNERPLRWEIMLIKPNATFKFHAHPNIEFIYVIKGTFHEFRLQTAAPQKNYQLSLEGPDLRRYAAQDFKCNNVSEMDQNRPIEDSNRFIINEIGSCHLSYTLDEGCVLLVLWGGGHASVALEHYPSILLPVVVEGHMVTSATSSSESSI